MGCNFKAIVSLKNLLTDFGWRKAHQLGCNAFINLNFQAAWSEDWHGVIDSSLGVP